jgi:exodeoxyribonuclease V alpha subunit
MKEKIDLKKHSYRFDAAKGIGKFSQEVIDGTFDRLSAYEKDEQITIDIGYDKHLFKKYALEYKSFILEADIKKALELMNQVRFLCVTRENENSVADTNKRIELILKKEIKDLLVFNPKGSFYHNQPIIITQNNYDLKIFNGDVGLIRRENDRLVAYFESTDGAVKKIPAGYLSHYDTVFAMTIHKSQGSEFDHVVVILPEKHAKKLLTRELLYTGVTRAKTKVLIQSSEETLMECVKQGVVRSSGLEQRLTERETL